MLSIIKNKLPYIITFILFYFIYEALIYNFSNINGIASYFVIDLFIILFFTSFSMLFKSNKVTIIILSLLMFLMCALFIVNVHIYNIFGDILTISYLKVLNEATVVFSWSFIKPMVIILGLFIYVLFIFSNCLIYKLYKINPYNSETEYIVNGLFVTILSTLVFGILISISISRADKTTYVNGKRVSNKSYIRTLTKKAYKHYGILGFLYKEIDIMTSKNNGSDSIISNYSSESPYEGLLKDKNVITIMGESLQDYCICEELTPNLYYLQQNGLYFNNNYSVNKTNMSEMIGITGSYYSFYDANYDVDFSIPNILKGKYKSTYIHDNNPEFYGRGNLTKHFGFDHTYFHDDLYSDDFTSVEYPYGITGYVDGDWGWNGEYTLDSVTIRQALPYMVDETNLFYSYFTSLVMHGPYTGGVSSNLTLYKQLGYYTKVEEAMENNKWTNPLKGVAKYEEYLKYYECAAMDFDKAIGEIIDYLKDKDLFDDTLLVIYGDHEVYYHDIYLKIANTTDLTQVDKLYQTTLIMFNPKLNEKVLSDYSTKTLTTFSSPYIVCPTILDLLGVSYDKNWYINYSYFDSRYLKTFYSYQQSAFMDNYFYSTDLETLSYVRDKSRNSEGFIYDSIQLMERIEYTNDLYEKSMIRKN